jgi:hypothetical protein
VKNNIASFLVLGAGLLASALATPAGAAIPVGPDGKVQVGGFFSQGYLHSSDNNYPTANKGGTWDFREMAVNVSTTFGSRLRIGGQAFAQRFGNLGEDKVILDWAVADYNVSPLLGFRVGRVKYPKGLYGEALDLDVVRPYVFLPNAVYSLVMRDLSRISLGQLDLRQRISALRGRCHLRRPAGRSLDQGHRRLGRLVCCRRPPLQRKV